MAGSSNFPTSVDNKTPLVDGVDYQEADNVNNAYVPLNKTQTFIGANGKGASWSTDILEYLANQKAPICTKASASTISVSTGTVFIKNSGQTNRIMRRNTSATTVTASDIDTGALADDTYYYLFAVADSAATTFTVKFSLSSTAPTGLTNFELIGWFFNQSAAALDITIDRVGNVKTNGRDVPNTVKIEGTSDITTTSTSLVDMTDMEIRFYTSGRPIQVYFDGSFRFDTITGTIVIDIAGATKRTSIGKFNFGHGEPMVVKWQETLAAGTYTIKIQWKVSSGTGEQRGSTEGSRLLTVIEL
jgi:hypothetical protein